MARCGGALTHHAERVDLCAYWRPGSSADHLVTGANRRCSQLGISLLLVARRGADFARVNARGLSRYRHILAAMAIARTSRKLRTIELDLRRAWHRSLC